MKLVAHLTLEIIDLPEDYRGMTKQEDIIISPAADLAMFGLAILFKVVTFYFYTARRYKDKKTLNEDLFELGGAILTADLKDNYRYGEIDPQAPYDYVREIRDIKDGN